MPRSGIIFDRDGTLIDVVRDEETGVVSTAFSPAHLRLLDGVEPGLRALHRSGFLLAIATNQPGPAKGQISEAAVIRTNAALVTSLEQRGAPIAALRVCMHHPNGGPGGDLRLVGPCGCRKPAPGMLEEIVEELGLDRKTSWMVGDSVSDVVAGQAAGLRTALLMVNGRCELCPLRAAGDAAPFAVGARSPDMLVPTIEEFASRLALGL